MYEEIKDYKGPCPRQYTLVSGVKRGRDDPSVIAYCSSSSHSGYLTQPMINKHQCFFKQCSCLHKIPENPFWEKPRAEYLRQVERRRSEKGRNYLNVKKEIIKEQAAMKAQDVVRFSENWVKINGMDDVLKIIGASPVDMSTTNFRLFYVSNQACYDATNYLDLIKDIQKELRTWVKLVHVKNTNGDWVTIDEYNRRTK